MKNENASTGIPSQKTHVLLNGLINLNATNVSDKEIVSVLEDANLSEWTSLVDNVSLSLNKRGRWNTVQYLKNNLEDGIYNCVDFSVMLVEKTRVCKRILEKITSNSIESQEIKLPKVLAKFVKRKFTKRKERRSGTNNHRSRRDEISENTCKEIKPPTRELRVEVLTQGSKVLQRHPHRNTVVRMRKVKHTQLSTTPPLLGETHQCLVLDSLSDDSYDGGCETESEDQTSSKGPAEMILGDFMVVEKSKIKEICKKIHKDQALTRKGNIRYISKSEFDKFKQPSYEVGSYNSERDTKTNNDAFVHNPPTDTTYFTVTLRGKYVTQDVLNQTLGDRYIECGCYPRRFLVDITDDLRGVPDWLISPLRIRKQKQRKYYTDILKTPQLVTKFGFLKFEEFANGKFRICVVTDSNAISTESLEAAAKTTPNHSVTTLLKLSREQIAQFEGERSTVNAPSSVGPKFHTLKTLLGWPETKTSYPGLHDGGLKPANHINRNKIQRTKENNAYCNICFEGLDESFENRGLTLSECMHSFCISCWNSHVATAVTNGGLKIGCPEYGCQSGVDEGTLASLLSVNQLRVYRTRVEDIKLQTSGSKVWCPRPGCEHIVSFLSESKIGNIRCDCGATFCLKCRGHPHWPATCHHFKQYEEDLKRFNDDNMVSWTSNTTKAKGKRCPACKTFIVKNAGCPNMVCFCGHSFCWQCLKPWNIHSYNTECYGKHDEQDTQIVQEAYLEDIRQKPMSRTRMYLLALETRHQRHLHERESLASHIPSMKRILNGIVARQKMLETRGGVTRSENWKRDAARARQCLETGGTQGRHLLDWTLDLFFEIHHVLEYCAVLLNYHKRGVSRIPHHMASLTFLASRLHTIFEDGHKQRMMLVPIKLSHIANLTINTLTELKELTHLSTRPRQ